ncbi:hypothetical protein [Roseiterribacter gracilis]
MKLLSATALLLIGTAAAAPPPDPAPAEPKANKMIPTEPAQRRADETLSDKLDRSDGVLHPAPTQDGAAVRKPPVTPNGDRDVIVPPTEKTDAVNPK